MCFSNICCQCFNAFAYWYKWNFVFLAPFQQSIIVPFEFLSHIANSKKLTFIEKFFYPDPEIRKGFGNI